MTGQKELLTRQSIDIRFARNPLIIDEYDPAAPVRANNVDPTNIADTGFGMRYKSTTSSEDCSFEDKSCSQIMPFVRGEPFLLVDDYRCPKYKNWFG